MKTETSMASVRRPSRGSRSSAWIVVLALAMLGSTGCSASKPSDPTVPPQASNEELNRQIAAMASHASDGNDYQIGPEDLLEVTLFDLLDEQGAPRQLAARVSNSGSVTLPYVGTVTAAGMTPIELEEQLRSQYRQFIHQPQLTVFVREYRSFRVSVLGYVTTPGVVDLKGRKSLLEVIALAGGLTDEAGKNVKLTRVTAEGAQTILVDLDRIASEGDVALNLEMQPNDVVTVPKAGMFYVEGVVKKPGAYPLLNHLTVSQAVATAGGADESIAKTSGTVLYRKTENGDRVSIPVDLAALNNGKIADVPVQEDDVIVVPVSVPRFWFDRITTGVLRVGLNAPLY